MSDNKKRFLPAEVGMDAKNNPRAFHLEGYISRPAYYKEATDEKKAYLGTSMGIGMSPERLMALANGTYQKDKSYGDRNFVTLNLFGAEAENFSKNCEVGLRVAVCGRLEWHEYTATSGETNKELRVAVDKIVILGGKDKQPVLSSDIGFATRVYSGRDGVQRTMNYAELLTGEVVGARALATSDNGKKYLAFGLKAKIPAEKVYDLANGTYHKDKSYDEKRCITNIVVFDKTAEALANVIRNGALVIASGPVTDREYNGDVSYQMKARVVSIMKFAPRAENSSEDSSAAPAGSVAEAGDVNSSGFVPLDDEGDDELPF